jgi:hypothetical protein
MRVFENGMLREIACAQEGGNNGKKDSFIFKSSKMLRVEIAQQIKSYPCNGPWRPIGF